MRNNRTSQDMLREIVGLSYNNLPDYLKTCLLYLSMYPEGYTFLKTDLVKQWSAEGFISATEGNDTSEVAEFNFDELVCTGLIQPNCIDFSEEVTFYTVHSTVFEVIRCKSMEENFTTVIDYSEVITKLSAKVRRVSLTFSSAKYATKPEGITLSEVRSLIFYGLAKCLPSIMELKLLRVLILEFWGDKKELDISGINKLFQLRYLRITTDMTVKLPARMQELLYLETIETYARVTTFPSDAFDLPRLMHLCLQDVINLPDGIGQMRSLRTLQFFDLSRNSYDNVRSLEELTNLRDLHLTCCSTSSSLEHHIMRNLIALVSSLEKLGNLKTMVLAPAASCTSINLCYSGNMSSLPVFLQRLELLPPICIFSRIPIWMGQLQKLCSLKIALSELSSGDVDNIARLPELTILSLYVRQPTAESIIFNRASFPVLKCLKFRCGVMRLTFLAGTMPNLRRLKLEFNAHSGEQYGDILVGIEHLLNLQEIIGRIGAAPGAEESDRMAAESMFKDATISKHSRLTSFNLQRVNSFGEEISRCADTPWSHSGSAVDSRFSGVFDLPSAYQPSCHLKSDENSKHHVLVSILRDESAKPSTLDLSLLKNITNNFSSEKEIDQGGFGMVYKGILGDVIVAVKRLYGQHGNVDGKFARVIDCLMTVKHSNIVRFLGYCVHTQPKGIKDGMKTFCVEQQEMLLCFEYLHNGSLQRYITEESCGLEWHTRYQIIKGICQGLGYLHENSIIHLDLKPENILLDANMVPKIADYAYARLLSEDSRTASQNFTTSLDYMAPEYYEDGVFSFKSDIYSLGIIIMQIVTGQKDHGNIMSVLGGWRSRLESDTSRTHTALETAYHQVTLCIVMGQNCMHRDPRKRPVLWEILDRLGEMGTSEESVTRGISLVPEFKNHSVPKSSNKEVFQWPSEKVKASLTSLLTSGKDNINKHQQAKTSSETKTSDVLTKSSNGSDDSKRKHNIIQARKSSAENDIEESSM
ncbi:disease resistance protein RGA5-like isoform X3 [Panicum virgatum]|uniref:disease resistance protein RGA5-like isoform X3 n=1 Tax=Panicum virgatum TaxID=38727 RepID=UPI0019D664A0|nr:disease resistance protein RGA5-like isoform X3 [Panicum virgatum]